MSLYFLLYSCQFFLGVSGKNIYNCINLLDSGFLSWLPRGFYSIKDFFTKILVSFIFLVYFSVIVDILLRLISEFFPTIGYFKKIKY